MTLTVSWAPPADSWPTTGSLFAYASAVGLDALGDADLQCRVDCKYLLTLGQLGTMADELCATYSRLTIDGLTKFAYRSDYLDTADLECFRAHLQDRRLRWKARTRLYVDSGLCRFELKLKTGRGDTDKHSIQIGSAERGSLPAAGRGLLVTMLAERYGAVAPPVLERALTVTHNRTTLVAGAERVTLDTDLVFSGPQGFARLREDLVLVETKSRGGRSRADEMLRAAGVRPLGVSKYCAGISLTRPGVVDTPWRPLLRRYFAAA